MKRWLIVPYLILSLAIFAACGLGDDADDADDTAEEVATEVDVEGEATEADIGGDDAETPEMDMTPEMDTTPESDMTPEMDMTPETDMTGTPESDMTPEMDMTPDTDSTGTPESDMTPEADMTDTPDANTTPETDMTGTPEADSTPGMASGDGVTFAMGEPFLVGLPFQVTEVMVTVDEAMMVESMDDIEPETGNQFIGVSMMVENATGDRLPLAQFLATVSLTDASDEQYPVNLQATTSSMLDGSFQEALIESDGEAQGTVVFEVPEDVTDLTLVFDPDRPGGGADSIMVELEMMESQ